jgi:hypothetical protein
MGLKLGGFEGQISRGFMPGVLNGFVARVDAEFKSLEGRCEEDERHGGRVR